MNRLFSVCSAPSRNVCARQRTFWFPVFFLHLNRLWLGVGCLLLDKGNWLSRGLRLFSAHWYFWGREDGLARMGGGVFVSLRVGPSTLSLRGCSAMGISAPRGQQGKMLPWEEGRQCSLCPQKVVWSQKCAGFVPNPAMSCRNTLLEMGPGWAGSDWQSLLLPRACIQLLFMASSVCRSGSQPRQETIWLRVLESSSHGIYR